MHKRLRILKRWFVRFAEWIAILITISYLVLALIPNLLPVEPFVDLIVLAIGIATTGIIATAKESLEPLEEQIDGLDQRLEPIQQQMVKLDESVRSIPGAQICFLEERKQNLEQAIELVIELTEEAESDQSKSPTLWLTDFGNDLHKDGFLEVQLAQKLKAFVHAGGTLYQINYYKAEDEEIKNIRADAYQFQQSGLYHLTALIGRQFGPLYFDILVAGERAALLTTSKDPSDPLAAGSAFFLQDTKSIEFLKNVFNSIWQQVQRLDNGFLLCEGKEVKEDNIMRIEDLVRKQAPCLARGFDANYEMASKMIEDAPDGSEICLTSMRKPLDDSKPFREYLKRRDERIIEGKIHFRRVFAFSNEAELDHLQAHLERCQEGSLGKNYSLGIFHGTEGTGKARPYFDMLLVKGREALLQIPCEMGGKEKYSAIRVTEEETLAALAIYFEELWQQAFELKRRSVKIDEDFLVGLRKDVESIPVHPWFAHEETTEHIGQQRFLSSSSVTALSPRENSYASMLDDLRHADDSLFIISYYKLLTGPNSRRDRYFDEVRAAMERGVRHCRIVWNRDHLQWLEERFAQGWDQLSDFQVYFLPQEDGQGLTTFDLIDERIVLMSQGWRGSGHIRIDNTEAASFFRSYFERKWEKAARYPIKEAGKPPDLELLAQLKDKMRSHPLD